MKTLHVDITYLCNYHCEYCYQGIEKQAVHIHDKIYFNLIKYLEDNKHEKTNLVLIGGEPFLYPRFFELVEKTVNFGHNITVATNFSMPKHMLDKFFNLTQGHLSRFKISLHLTQLKNLEEFYTKVDWLKTKIPPEIIRIGSVLTEENFLTLVEIDNRLKSMGLSFLYQRIFDEKGYCIYSDEIENYLKKNHCVDISLNFVKNKNFNVFGKSCSCGHDFYKILIDGTVTRCFTKQLKGYNVLGNMAVSDKIKKLPRNMPCLSENQQCRCYYHFVNDGQLNLNIDISKFKIYSHYIIPEWIRRHYKKSLIAIGTFFGSTCYKQTFKALVNHGLFNYIKNLIKEQSFSYEHFLTVGAIVKDEGPYLKEWIEYHKLMGVENFYIYDNGSTDNIKEILQPYIADKTVIYREYPGRNMQGPAYRDIVEEVKDKSKWLALIDIDEFLVPIETKTIAEFLKKLPFWVYQLSISWVLYGSNGHITKPEGLVIENFKMRAQNNTQIKSIANPRAILEARAHGSMVLGYSVDENLKLLFNPTSKTTVSYNKVRCNHYQLKSKEEYEYKFTHRGDVVHGLHKKYDEAFFEENDKNEVFDNIMDNYIELVKNKI